MYCRQQNKLALMGFIPRQLNLPALAGKSLILSSTAENWALNSPTVMVFMGGGLIVMHALYVDSVLSRLQRQWLNLGDDILQRCFRGGQIVL